MAVFVLGRPGRLRAERHVHWRRSHWRCQRTTVLGCTTIRAVRQSRHACEQHPKQSISVAESGTLHGAPEHGQLLTECQILECDRLVSTADQISARGSEHDDERSQHEPSCPAVNHRINRRGRRSDSGERQGRGSCAASRSSRWRGGRVRPGGVTRFPHPTPSTTPN
jgi:hypothetical protein